METVIKINDQAKIPTVVVYTRHAKSCRFAQKKDETGETISSGSTLKNSCNCAKWLRYSLKGKLVCESAKTSDHAVALARAADRQKKLEAAAEGKVVESKDGIPMLKDALAKYIANKQNESDKTSAKYLGRIEREMASFVEWAAARNLMFPADVTIDHGEDYRNGLKGAQSTRWQIIKRAREMYRYFVVKSWARFNPFEHVKVKSSQVQRARALSDEQYKQLLDAIPQVNGQTTDEQRRKLRALVLLMYHTGLAVRDAVSIRRDDLKLNGGGYWRMYLRREKTGKPAECLIRPEVVAEILEGTNPATAPYLFVNSWMEKDDDAGKTREQRAAREHARDLVAQRWGKLVRDLGEVADLKDEHGAPFPFGAHSFRHTFCIRMLMAGMPTEDVAILVGDNPETVYRHYSEWIQSRQDRLAQRMM